MTNDLKPCPFMGRGREEATMHWIDDADHYICPICGFEATNPAKYDGCKCPGCGFQDLKDVKEKSMELRTCPHCGKEYTPRSVVQIYCSKTCQRRYKGPKPERLSITFTCAYYKCGRVVVTATDRPDKRTRFCCAECEKKYWRHPPKKSMLRNYHSIQEYAGYERRTNEE